MMMPPAVFRVRVVEPDKKKVNLWLPLFTLWPTLLLLVLVSLPLLLVMLVAAAFSDEVMKALRRLKGAAIVICSLRGLQVNVSAKNKEVRVYVY